MPGVGVLRMVMAGTGRSAEDMRNCGLLLELRLRASRAALAWTEAVAETV